jgi:hypothetical protein
LTEVIEIEAIERDFCEAWRTGGNPKPLPFNGPTIALIGIEMNVSLVNIDQQTTVMERVIQVPFKLL